MIASVPELLITSSVLILALLVLRRLLRGRISRRLQYSLWGLAALRLLLPFSLPAGSSVMNLPTARRMEAVIAGQTVRVEAGGVAAVSPVIGSETAAAPGLHPLAILWLLGVLALAGWFFFANLWFARRLRANRRPMAALSPLPVYQVSGLSSPCLFGLFHPAVYLPDDTTGDPMMLRHILAHEECHWRQKDHLWALVRAACLCLYWFHPLVWAAATASREDCEQACDERALRLLGEGERLAYGRTLVAVVRQRRPSCPGCTATAMCAGRHSLQRRIGLIVSGSRTRAWAAAALAACAAVLIGCTFTGSQPNATPAPTRQAASPTAEPEEETEPAGFRACCVTFDRGSFSDGPGFDVRLLLPDGWEIRSILEPGIYNMPMAPADPPVPSSPLAIWEGDQLVARLRGGGYEVFEEGLAPEEEYKAAFAELQLSSSEIWSGYTAVCRQEQGETGTMEVTYKDPTYWEEHPDGSAAEASDVTTRAILGFDRELQVYVALQFEPEREPDEATLALIADSLRLGAAGTL